MRQVMNAILYVVRTGCQWAALRHEYPNSNSVYYHFRKWCQSGLWRKLNAILCRWERRRQGRKAHPSAAVMDKHQNNRSGRR